MKNNELEIAAGIVLFNPEINRLKANIDAISSQVNKVFLVDNGSKNRSEIEKIVTFYNNISIQYLDENMGIAFALNKLVKNAKNNAFTWIVTLDQDSICNNELVKNYKELIAKLNDKNIGCFTCNIIDRNYFRKEKHSEGSYKYIKYCITSGSLMNISALERLGGFDEKMFIDKVDTEICIRLLMNKYKIVRMNYDGLLHEIGHAKQINLGFRKWELYNHKAIRRYYMTRNSVYLFKKFHTLYTFKLLIGEIFQSLLVLIFENDKVEKLMMESNGFKDGVMCKHGMYKGNAR